MFREEALNILKENGYKITKPRAWIVDYLDGNKSHPSAIEIFEGLRKNNKNFSFATVYNTLDTLVKSGVVKQVMSDPQCARFDPDISQHSHFMCTKCGKVKDLFNVKIEMSSEEIIGNAEGYELTIYGVCDSCSKGGN